MLSAPARKASAIPSPIRMRGIARTNVAEVIAYQEPNAPLHSADNATAASYPDTSSQTTSTSSPLTTAASATHAGLRPCPRTTPALRPTEHQSADVGPRCPTCHWDHRATRHHDD